MSEGNELGVGTASFCSAARAADVAGEARGVRVVEVGPDEGKSDGKESTRTALLAAADGSDPPPSVVEASKGAVSEAAELKFGC